MRSTVSQYEPRLIPTPMRTVRHDDLGFAAALRSLNRRATPAPHVAEAVAAIIAEVRATGDAALLQDGD